ncbi:conjugal transfer protein TraG N-terminal domain-containing protein [Enterobacter asburiae]|uniref:complement resistance protein TraT n=1 Tax=Enterobacter asburiae TaxID=61645 RepID=UPI001BDE0134|nr:complement resistance protein TraT [Enterobacter asburiae]MBT1734899.1 conjugal transfer protein TraG N-terminal domain-containing protein [Enterobacter asburiae]
MLEIYTIYGGGMWKTALDAVVTLVGQNTFHTLLRIASTFGVLAVLLTFIKQRNPMVFVQWLAVFMILTSILLVPKRSVQVIDLSDPGAVWVTDNVPVGLAAIASLTTSIGYKMASVYDMLMARPDSVTYSKTGMLFGSQIVAETSDFATQNPELAQMLPDYVENCVIGDILLNGKYTINQLLNSTDPLTLITSNPSPLRGIFKMTSTSRQFLTCQQAATEIQKLANTSDKDMSGLQAQITNELAAKGYRVSSSPDTAYYWIQANVLKAEKMDLRDAQGFLKTGYEGAAMGAALGAGITAYNSSSAGATLGVGLATGLIGMAADAMVEDVNYTMVTDLQISERSKAAVTTDNIAALKQGTSGIKLQTSTEQGNRAKYQTRVVSNANKVNLKFEEAKPVLEAQLAKSIAGIM